MGLITWVAVALTILAIIGLGLNVFVSGVYKGVQKVMGNSDILKEITEKAQESVGNFTKNGSEGKMPTRPASDRLLYFLQKELR
jgi:hypothetical protein